MSGDSHFLAVRIEHRLRSIFNCDRCGFGGLVDADVIERDPYNAFIYGLSAIYLKSSQSQKVLIDNFIESLYQYEGKRIEDIGISTVENLLQQFEKLV